MIRAPCIGAVVAVLATTTLACSHLGGESPPQAEGGCSDNPTATLSIAIDETVGTVQTSTGWLVPLEVVLQSPPCFEGVAHATLLSSAGQFSSAGAVLDAGKAASSGGGSSDGGAEGGGGSSSGGSDAGAAAGANTTLTLTPDGRGGLVGFATLSLSGALLSTRVQAVVGDWSACETLTSTPTPSLTNAGVCAP